MGYTDETMSLAFTTFIVAWLWLCSCGASHATGQPDQLAPERSAVFQLKGDEACDFPDDGLSIASGHVQAAISGQDARLEADQVVYDQYNQVVEAIGNVRIWRYPEWTTGSKFAFKIDSDEYLVMQPDTKVGACTVISKSTLSNLDRERLEYRALKVSRAHYKPRLKKLTNASGISVPPHLVIRP